jgi:hypothetical protein
VRPGRLIPIPGQRGPIPSSGDTQPVTRAEQAVRRAGYATESWHGLGGATAVVDEPVNGPVDDSVNGPIAAPRATLPPTATPPPRLLLPPSPAGFNGLVHRLAASRLGTPRVALALTCAGLILLILVGSSAPNVNTLLIRLPLSVLPAQPAWLTYPVMAAALLLECAGLAGMLWSRNRGWSPSPWRLYALGALFVAIIVNLAPVGSSDTASYAAYGRLTALGYDPYAITPFDALQHTAYYPLISASWQHTASVYGPVATWVQSVAASVGGTRPWLTIWALLILNGAAFLAVGLLLLRRSADPVRATILWTANPLLIEQLVTGGHLDTLVAGGTVCALILTRRGGSPLRDAAAGAALGVAAGVKIDAGLIALAIAWPLLRRQDWRRLATIATSALIALIAVYAPYGVHALQPLTSASKLVALPSVWGLPWLAGKAVFGGSATLAVISVLWPLLLLWLVWRLGRPLRTSSGALLRTGSAGAGREQATYTVLVMAAWIIAAPWAMPWYSAPGWAALTELPRNPLTRWLIGVTAVLAVIHSSGGHPW